MPQPNPDSYLPPGFEVARHMASLKAKREGWNVYQMRKFRTPPTLFQLVDQTIEPDFPLEILFLDCYWAMTDEFWLRLRNINLTLPAQELMNKAYPWETQGCGFQVRKPQMQYKFAAARLLFHSSIVEGMDRKVNDPNWNTPLINPFLDRLLTGGTRGSSILGEHYRTEFLDAPHAYFWPLGGQLFTRLVKEYEECLANHNQDGCI